MSKVETILQVAFSAINTDDIGVPIERSRVIPFERDELPAIVLRPLNEDSEPVGTNLLRCMLAIAIDIHTRGDIPDAVADPIADAVDVALRGSVDLRGQIAKVFRSNKAWEFSDADLAAGKLTLTYQIHYTDLA